MKTVAVDDEGNCVEVEKDLDSDLPIEYKKHDLSVKGNRAKQLHRHDLESKCLLDDMDNKIELLKKIRERLKRKIPKERSTCQSEKNPS